MTLTQNELKLLDISAKELIGKLTEGKDYSEVRQEAFGWYAKETDEEFQVQVLVTRNKKDFIPTFTTEYTKQFKP